MSASSSPAQKKIVMRDESSDDDTSSDDSSDDELLVPLATYQVRSMRQHLTQGGGGCAYVAQVYRNNVCVGTFNHEGNGGCGTFRASSPEMARWRQWLTQNPSLGNEETVIEKIIDFYEAEQARKASGQAAKQVRSQPAAAAAPAIGQFHARGPQRLVDIKKYVMGLMRESGAAGKGWTFGWDRASKRACHLLAGSSKLFTLSHKWAASASDKDVATMIVHYVAGASVGSAHLKQRDETWADEVRRLGCDNLETPTIVSFVQAPWVGACESKCKEYTRFKRVKAGQTHSCPTCQGRVTFVARRP